MANALVCMACRLEAKSGGGTVNGKAVTDDSSPSERQVSGPPPIPQPTANQGPFRPIRVLIFGIVGFVVLLGIIFGASDLSGLWGSSGAEDGTVVREFVQKWHQYQTAATYDMDSRTISEARGVIYDIKLKSFDGRVQPMGENVITVYATGAQYPVWEFEVRPVVDFKGLYMPVRMTVSVAKDSGKVLAVMPHMN